MATKEKDCAIYLVPGSPYYRARYRDREGTIVRESLGIENEAEAQKEANRRRDNATREITLPEKTTLQSAIDQLIRNRQRKNKRPKTIEMYELLGGHILRILGPSTPLANIGAEHFDQIIDVRKKEKSKPYTIHKTLMTFKLALSIAWARGEYPRDPKLVVKGSAADGYDKEYRPRSRWLGDDREHGEAELYYLAWALAVGRGQSNPPRPTNLLKAAQMLFCVATGCRWEESVEARRSDIYLEGRERGVILDGSDRSGDREGQKTYTSHRKIPILPPCEKLLVMALEISAQHHPKSKSNPDDKLFPRWNNHGRDLKKACARTGKALSMPIKPVSPNDLRRTCGHRLSNAGYLDKDIAPFLGHTTTTMCRDIYVNVAKTFQERMINTPVAV